MIERHDTIVIGGGQAGLAAGYHLAQHDQDFVILDASERIGDSWRQRWDSLRLFTSARYDGLPGMAFPAPPHSFPTKDEMGDFLEAYAHRFQLPVRSGVRVDDLSRVDGRYRVSAGDRRFEADNVIVAMANYQEPWTPEFASRLDPEITQIHSAEYRRPSQLRPGRVLIVGAGNSGSEIAMELAPRHQVWMSGRNTGQLPFRISGLPGRLFLAPLVLRFLFYRVLSVDTPIGRKARPKIVGKGGPLIRVKDRDLRVAGVQRAPRVDGVREGRPVLEDDRVMDVENVVWCTGYRTGFQSWINLPIHGHDEATHGATHEAVHEPVHERGTVPGQPGLYFVGLFFQRALSSVMIHGVGRDAEEIVRAVVRRSAPAPRASTAGSRSRPPLPARSG